MKQRQQSSTSYPITFLMVDSADHITGKTGLSPTVTISKNGAGFGAPSGAVSEIGNGWYALAGNATDRGTLGDLLIHATAAGADPVDDRYVIVPWNPFDAAALGLSNLDAAITSRLAPSIAGRTLDVAATGEASANVTHHAGVAVAAADLNGNVPVIVKAWYDALVPEPDTAGYPDVGTVVNISSQVSQQVRDAMKLAPSGGAAAAGSVDAHLDAVALEATAQAILEDTGTTLPTAIAVVDANVDLLLAMDTSTTDATTAGAISRRRGNSWAIPLTIGAITGYTSLWFTIKSSHDDADTAAIVQIKKNASASLDGLLYVNGTTASSDALGSITVSDATTGAIVIAVDETITDDLAPGEYCYDVQTLIEGDVATPDSGTFTVTADVTRSVT